jgi:hypothetical protein
MEIKALTREIWIQIPIYLMVMALWNIPMDVSTRENGKREPGMVPEQHFSPIMIRIPETIKTINGMDRVNINGMMEESMRGDSSMINGMDMVSTPTTTT